MKILVEIPKLPDELAKLLAAAAHFDCWDGYAIDSAILEQIPTWEDHMDSVELPWMWLNSLLPDDISAQLTEMPEATRNKFLDHTEHVLRRGASLSLRAVSLDLSIDRLAWPDTPQDDVKKGLAGRLAVMEELVKRAQKFDVKTCISLRLPLPSIAQAAEGLAMQLVRNVANAQCRLILNIVIDELKSVDPEIVLSPYFECLEGIRLRYEPQLGVRPSVEMQESWAKCLDERGFSGHLIFAPFHSDLAGFEFELDKLANEVPTWRR